MKKLSKIIGLMMVAVSAGAVAADRDPFLPYTWSSPAPNTDNKSASASVAPESKINPLVDKPLSAYTVIGVVVSPRDALAVLKSRDKREYFAYVGDPVGLEGGVIETINSEGITVDMGGRVITMKVSNRFDIQDGQQDEKK